MKGGALEEKGRKGTGMYAKREGKIIHNFQ